MITSSKVNIAPEWIVLVAGTVGALHIGKLPPAIPALQADLGISLVESAFLLSLVQLAGMLGGVLIGYLVSAKGLRRSALRGLSLLTVTSLIGGFVESTWLLLTLRVIEGLGFLMVALTGPGLIRQLVPQELLSLRMGWWGCYMGFGTGIGMLIGPWVIADFSWTGWWWFVSILTLGCLFWFKSAIPASVDQHSDLSIKVRPQFKLISQLTRTLSHANPWLLAVMFACYSGQWLAVIGFLPTIYTEMGISGGIVGLLTAGAALINTLGNMLSGKLIHAGYKAQHLIVFTFAVMALMTWVTYSGTLFAQAWTQYIAVLIFSSVGGIIPGVLFFLAVKLAPAPELVPTTTGWMLQCSAIGQLSSPPLLALIASSYGDWSLTWIFSAILSLTGIFLATRIGGRIKLHSDPT